MDLIVIAAAAAGLGFLHTVMGPDHYVPFAVIARSRDWSLARTIGITAVCGIGHIAGSVILGLVGIALGTAVTGIVEIESFRGDLAAWILIAFGFTYAVWGYWKAIRGKPHSHPHEHTGGGHDHPHGHEMTSHVHVHDDGSRVSLTPWVLFAIFVFGPCEPLIPLLFYPAARGNAAGAIPVAAAFGIATILTMIAAVTLSVYGLKKVPFRGLEKYSHCFAGIAILLCGVGIAFLGL